jgi:hypothetical protein
MKGSWSFHSPCLLTFELKSLIAWLREIKMDGLQTGIEFIEPNIRVEARGNSLYVWFSQGSAPQWASDDEKYGEGVPVRLPFETNDFQVSVDVLKAFLKKFPMRGTPSWMSGALT